MSKAVEKFLDDILSNHEHAVNWAESIATNIDRIDKHHNLHFIHDLVSESELLLLEAKNINKAVLELLANYKKEKEDE